MSIRPKVEAALSATAERLSPGSGSKVVRRAKNELMMVDGSTNDLAKRFADAAVLVATPALFEFKHPEGDPVTIAKKRDGLVAVFPDALLFVRGMGMGMREVKALDAADLSVEPVRAAFDGSELPGLRIAGPGGHPTFVLAVALLDEQADAAQRVAVRDEIQSLLGR